MKSTTSTPFEKRRKGEGNHLHTPRRSLRDVAFLRGRYATRFSVTIGRCLRPARATEAPNSEDRGSRGHSNRLDRVKPQSLCPDSDLGGGIPLLGDRCELDGAHALVLTLFVILTGERHIVAGLDRLE